MLSHVSTPDVWFTWEISAIKCVCTCVSMYNTLTINNKSYGIKSSFSSSSISVQKSHICCHKTHSVAPVLIDNVLPEQRRQSYLGGVGGACCSVESWRPTRAAVPGVKSGSLHQWKGSALGTCALCPRLSVCPKVLSPFPAGKHRETERALTPFSSVSYTAHQQEIIISLIRSLLVTAQLSLHNHQITCKENCQLKHQPSVISHKKISFQH